MLEAVDVKEVAADEVKKQKSRHISSFSVAPFLRQHIHCCSRNAAIKYLLRDGEFPWKKVKGVGVLGLIWE